MDVNPKATQCSRAAPGILNTLDSSSKASIMNRVILKAFLAVHALIQSSGNRKADPSPYTTNLDVYGIMHNLLIYFYSDIVVSEPSSAGIWERRKRF